MYHIQQVDEGYQIFSQATVQEYPPEVVSSPVQGEQIYASREEALGRIQELNRRVRQQLGRVVEVTIQCESIECEHAVRAACAELAQPLREMLEFLTFMNETSPSDSEELRQGTVSFLMRLLEPFTHADADMPLRDLLSSFLQFSQVAKVSYSFRVVEVVD